jgi:hypothetical protein
MMMPIGPEASKCSLGVGALGGRHWKNHHIPNCQTHETLHLPSRRSCSWSRDAVPIANVPEINAPRPSDPDVHYCDPGTYHENINAQSGELIYLAPGAVVFGGLNIWGVENVKVLGRGTIVYDGPQNPNTDEGWMHKPDWHGIVMDHAQHIEINGITVIVRSRTWMIQMLSSRDVRFNNVKVIGGCPGNANQDRMDWLRGGEAVIRDSFLRASDDIFAPLWELAWL